MLPTNLSATSEEEEEEVVVVAVMEEAEGEEDDHDDDDDDEDEDDSQPALLSDAQSKASDVSTSEDEDDDGALPPPPLTHTFAPPFYGRPPTPLPPSPSLTSLLRPSRPTTPDASDDDLEPVPRAAPKVPTYEYYGFVLYLFSSLCFLIYLLWSYLPSPFLHALGIYYYPNRWWSLAIPSFLVMAIVYIYVALAAYNTEIMTLPMGSVETIVDDAAQVAAVDARGRIRTEGRRAEERRRRGERGGRGAGPGGREVAGLVTPAGGLNWRDVWSRGTDAVMDVPLAGVCEVLYGDGREMREDGDGDLS
ncbi:PIG-P-domain-containing protein [Phialemonium atrogriseum]|uniref:PIG-P-domain-containing protein n=1 Tax=Phialemonium atrogriseum TaxID=1093897 RepID=A0AAJ0FGV2_9PEZI|nr:PIG-P-domain-containing protein [Phialemonium atrogriseum]KAK1766992.1 PIG-P-domain-containing protein [Phialemonium atrogriseum]